MLLKRGRPRAEVTVFERNRPDDTFGFGGPGSAGRDAGRLDEH
jgi:hypothetical protein